MKNYKILEKPMTIDPDISKMQTLIFPYEVYETFMGIFFNLSSGNFCVGY